ncbi:MAG: prenyltransferase, partial [Planctomycetia bacterium]|nr:prenyltransferase [Planctomycetia bacterium]
MKSGNLRCTRPLWIAVVAACALLWCGPAAADEESPRLAPFRQSVDRAVDLALLFLARAQADNPAGDGSFADVHGQTNAVAGLSGMAFLAKGYRPGAAPYGNNINRAIDYILATPTKNGYLGVRGGKMYEHSIATLFLSEVSGMVDPERQRRIDVVMPRALKIILDAQQAPKQKAENSGGWRYDPDSRDSDMSVTGWCLMALRSARLNGAPVPNKAIDDA